MESESDVTRVPPPPTPVPPNYRTEDFVLRLATDFIDPVGQRVSYTTSRLAVLSDGTTVPVLRLLAVEKFKTWAEEQFPFWIDGDRTNERLDNVDLATRASQKKGAGRKPGAKNSYGVPSGSIEYMRRWREGNREKVRASQKKYIARRKEILKQVTTKLAETPSAEPTSLLEKLQKAVGEE